LEVGQKLVALCQQGKNLEALDTLYSEDVESIEAMAMPEMPAKMKGVAAQGGVLLRNGLEASRPAPFPSLS